METIMSNRKGATTHEDMTRHANTPFGSCRRP